MIPDCEKMLQEEITETSHDITDCWGGGDVWMVGTEAGGVLATGKFGDFKIKEKNVE